MNPNPGRVLVVDDHRLNRKLVAEVLESAGYEMMQAATAEDALALLSCGPRPDLILMDIALPGIDGLTLTRQLKQDPTLSAVPVVAVTAFAMKGDEEKALAAGCAGYLTKPIDTRKLAATVAQHLTLAGK